MLELGQVVYVLCGLTSLGCTLLLLNRYRKTRVELLFWSGVAFFCFTATNVLLYVDLVVFPYSVDLSLLRNSVTLLGVVVLLYGLIKGST
jgi:hypothetical protein